MGTGCVNTYPPVTVNGIPLGERVDILKRVAAMYKVVVSCPECGHSLWAEACGVGQFNFVVYFDDERSVS
jgi:hypothetical protein